MMKKTSTSKRKEKQKILALLEEGGDIDVILNELQNYPDHQLIHVLFSGICKSDETIKWNAVSAMGRTVAKLADRDMEAGRIIMRRLMWSLNDESGGIGWGAAEAMAEIMACHEGLASEFGQMPVAYMREDGNYQELEAMQRGVIWGVGRLAMTRPQLMKKWNAGHYLLPYLESQDATVRGLAAWTLGILKYNKAAVMIQKLADDDTVIRLYINHTMTSPAVSQLAREALAGMRGTEDSVR